MAAMTFVEFLGFEVAAVRCFHLLPRMIRWGFGIRDWGLGTDGSGLGVLSVNLGDAAAKIGELLLEIRHACCDSNCWETSSHSFKCRLRSVRAFSKTFETRRLSSALT